MGTHTELIAASPERGRMRKALMIYLVWSVLGTGHIAVLMAWFARDRIDLGSALQISDESCLWALLSSTIRAVHRSCATPGQLVACLPWVVSNAA